MDLKFAVGIYLQRASEMVEEYTSMQCRQVSWAHGYEQITRLHGVGRSLGSSGV